MIHNPQMINASNFDTAALSPDLKHGMRNRSCWQIVRYGLLRAGRQLVRMRAAQFGQVFEKQRYRIGSKLSGIRTSGPYSANDLLHGMALVTGNRSNGRQARNCLSPPAKENIIRLESTVKRPFHIALRTMTFSHVVRPNRTEDDFYNFNGVQRRKPQFAIKTIKVQHIVKPCSFTRSTVSVTFSGNFEWLPIDFKDGEMR